MDLQIRKFHPSDLPDIYDICLKTGDSGNDASSIYKNKRLISEYYAAPYCVIEPESAFVLTKNNIPIGYIIGTINTAAFNEKCEKFWFPELRLKYKKPVDEISSPDANLIRKIHSGNVAREFIGEYPAHLHIDLLPEAQGKGFGKKLINTFINYLKSRDVSALHLEVGKTNSGAIKFYEHFGFHTISEYEYSIAYGIRI